MTVDPTPPQAGFLPQYQPPGLSVRATFLATDGSRPQELIIEWKHDPGQHLLVFVLDRIAAMASPGEVRVETVRPPAADESTTQLPRPFCDKTGTCQDGAGHGCAMFAGHSPVEPEGRQHRCA